MKEKKQSKDWYIATTHWLTAGVAVIVIGLVLGIPVAALVGETSEMVFKIATLAIWILGIWLGVMYAARYVNKTYLVKNSENIAKLATIYLVILGGGYRLIILSKGITIGAIIDTLLFAIGAAIFYMLSKKYIKNSEAVVTQQQ